MNWVKPLPTDNNFDRVTKLQKDMEAGLQGQPADDVAEVNKTLDEWPAQTWFLVAPRASEMLYTVRSQREKRTKAAEEQAKKDAKVAAVKAKREKEHAKIQKTRDDAPKKILALLKKAGAEGVGGFDILLVAPLKDNGTYDEVLLEIAIDSVAQKVPLEVSGRAGDWFDFRLRDSQSDYAGTKRGNYEKIRIKGK